MRILYLFLYSFFFNSFCMEITLPEELYGEILQKSINLSCAINLASTCKPIRTLVIKNNNESHCKQFLHFFQKTIQQDLNFINSFSSHLYNRTWQYFQGTTLQSQIEQHNILRKRLISLANN